MPRVLVSVLVSLLFSLPGCAVSGDLLSDYQQDTFSPSAFRLSEVPYFTNTFRGSPSSDSPEVVILTLEPETGQFLTQPNLLFSRGQNGAVQIQNGALSVAAHNIAIRAPLLSLFSCQTMVTSNLPDLSQR